MKPTIQAVGKVVSAKTVQGKAKDFLAVKIECPAIEYGAGKRFNPRCEARVRYRYEELDLHPGDFVVVTGQAEAQAFEYNGKWYGNLIVDDARITHIALPVREVPQGKFGDDGEDSLPKPKAAQAAEPATETAEDDSSDVPF